MIKLLLGFVILSNMASYAEETAPETPQVAATTGIVVNKRHKVVDGDTLWDISNKYYGDPLKWGKIYNFNLNLIKNPDLIFPDNEIEIPEIKETLMPEIKPVASSGAAPVSPAKEEVNALDSASQKEIGYLPPEKIEEPFVPPVAEISPEPGKVNKPLTEFSSDLEKQSAYEEEKVNDLELNEKMPEGQITFATMSKTLKVDGNFFEGEVLYKDSEDEMEREGFASKGDLVKVKLYSAKTSAPGDLLMIYQKGVDSDKKITVQYVGMMEILSLDGRKASCRVLKSNMVIDKTMFVKKLQKKSVGSGN